MDVNDKGEEIESIIDDIIKSQYEADYTEHELDELEEVQMNKILGYANVVQNSMLEECELVANMGIDCETEDFPVEFDDCGSLYFYIKEDDLKSSNFENIWCILQCY
ncbi:DUF1963 domain-containing protein [Intestinibacter sp.]|uniref:DUF1963 domain-containing protein n=1 Tax=Intestinibacter sp. TaxID=1965304 RepID=UPI003F157173